jgi:sigma-B regulation protein RsbU (phosphoserine phosphatase)
MTQKRTQICNLKLKILLEVTRLINSNAAVKNILNYFATILQKFFKIEKILIYHHSFNWKFVMRKGISLEDARKIDFNKHVKPVKDITHITYLNQNKPYLKQFDFIIPVYHKDQPLAYILIGDIDEEMSGVSPSIKHIQFIQTLTNIITVAIENKILFHKTLEREKFKKELEVAKQVQHYLIPDNNDLKKYSDVVYFEGFYKPHSDIGGDYYDVIALNQKEYVMCIADVSGKGVPAAILMANFQAHFRAILKLSNISSLITIIHKLNQIVIDLTKGNMFITFFIAKYNKELNDIKYVNAGHNPPLFYDAGTKEIKYLTEGTTGLGMTSETLEIKTGKIDNIIPKSKLILYTDGLVESIEKQEVVFDIENIKAVVKKGESLEKDMYNLKYMVESSEKFFDDISILGAEFY